VAPCKHSLPFGSRPSTLASARSPAGRRLGPSRPPGPQVQMSNAADSTLAAIALQDNQVDSGLGRGKITDPLGGRELRL